MPHTPRIAWTAAATLLLAWPLVFSMSFVARERTVYFWDFANYWLHLIDLSRSVRADPLQGLVRAIQSVSTESYGDLPTLGLLPAAFLWGSGRVAYVAAVVICFAWPAMLLAARLVRVLCAHGPQVGTGNRQIPVLATLGVMGFLPQIWFPIVLGSLDVVGCIAIFAVLLLLAGGWRGASMRRLIAIGILLGLLPLLRHWYAFFTVSLYAVLVADAVLAALTRRADEIVERSRRALRPLAIMGSATALTLLPLVGPAGSSVFLRDHLFLHAPYRGDSGILGAFERLWVFFGSLGLAAAALGFVATLRDSSIRPLTMVVAVQALTMLYAFNRVQLFGAHHFYLIIPALVLFQSYGLATFLQRAAGFWGLGFRAALASLLLGLNFAAFFFCSDGLPFGITRQSPLVVALFGRMTHAPMQRTDLREIERLTRAVHAALPRADSAVYVVASSVTLNPDILGNARLSLSADLPDLRAIVRAGAHVDRRDGFPRDLLEADVVVSAEPPQTHLDPAEQQVVVVPALEIARGTTIGRGLRALSGRFHLENGVVARIHVRESAITTGDREDFASRLSASHPEDPTFLRPIPSSR